MPMIQLTLPTGILGDSTRADLAAELSATLLRWEGAPDTAFFRAQTWCYINEVDPSSFSTLANDGPRFRVDVTVPEGALSPRRIQGLVTDATKSVCAAAGIAEADALRVWVLVHPQPEGTWGAGGTIIKFQELAALAARERKSD